MPTKSFNLRRDISGHALAKRARMRDQQKSTVHRRGQKFGERVERFNNLVQRLVAIQMIAFHIVDDGGGGVQFVK